MFYLIIVSCIWAFSFGISKVYLAGLDPFFVTTVRLFLALVIFIPFIRKGKLSFNQRFQLILLGAVQYGIMYITYIYCFTLLKAYEVALFSVFCPIYVILFNSIIERRLRSVFFLTASLSILGAGMVEYTSVTTPFWTKGFLLMQFSNMTFAAGQIYYRHWKTRYPENKASSIFAYIYAGGFLFALGCSIVATDWSQLVIKTSYLLSLLYLGIVASGIGLFFWNIGATKINAGALAVMNNLVVPLAVAVSLFFFDEAEGMDAIQLVRLFLGGGIILLALLINEYAMRINNK